MTEHNQQHATEDEDDVLTTLAGGPPALQAATEPADRSELLDELAALDLAIADRPFGDLDELIEAEHAENLGRSFDWPAMPGASVTIAHFSAAVDKKNQLEELYRRKRAKLPAERLSPRVEERLWEEAMLGTVVKGWAGLKRNGYDFPFTEANYRQLMRVRRFRAFVLEKARDADAFRAASDEDLRGNSSAA